MTHEHLELIDRARRRLKERDLPCTTGTPADDAAIDAAEEALGVPLPPSYRAFLRHFGRSPDGSRNGGLTLPHRVSTIHQLIGMDMVERTLTARVENKLGSSLLIVALGAQPGEWFCIDTNRSRPDGECAVFLFDARDNELDQQFYDDFDAMVNEVLTFVLEQLDEGADLSADDASDETSLGGMY